MKKTVYVLPGDLVEIRVCDPAFEEGANRQAWNLSARQRSILLEVAGTDTLIVPLLGLDVFCGTGATRRQMLPAIAKATSPDTQGA